MFGAVASLLNLETGVLLAGTTSTTFEADPDVGADGEPGLATPRAFPRTTAPTCRRSSSGWP